VVEKHPKAQIVQFSKLMYDKWLINSYEGKISIKHEEKVYITPSNIHKGMLTEDMIVVIENEENYNGSYKPSSEVKIHLGTYRV